MKLTEQESRWLSLWEKRERRWRFTRWIVILNGVVFSGGGIFIFHKLQTIISPSPSDFLFPFFFIFVGGGWFGLALSKWEGDIKLRLLLRLIREHEDKSS
jgi:hypothetical protein